MSDEIYEQGGSSKADQIDEPQKPAPNILNNENSIKIDEKFICKLEKGSKTVNKEVKDSCKVLHFSSAWNFEDVLTTIDGLDFKEYPQLFIFTIETKFTADIQEDSTKKVANLQKMLLKFNQTRPLILQLTSQDKKVTKISYKDVNSSQFDDISQDENNFEEIKDFSLFLCLLLNNKFDNFEDQVIMSIKTTSNLMLILRFLRILNLNDEFFKRAVLEVAKSGSEAELLAIVDAPFSDCGDWLNRQAQKYLTETLCFNQLEADSASSTSVLLTAIENRNMDIIDCLIFGWSHLIQELPFDHQVRASTAAFEMDQLDVVCDLLNIADFPFPKDLKVDSVDHERLKCIIAERASLTAAINEERIQYIEEFISENSELKVVYDVNNESALKQAVDASKIKVYVFLKLCGFSSANPNENFTEAEKEAKKYKIQQRKQNVNEGLLDDQRSVNSLCNRSIIHNKKISKEQEKEYRKKIRNWYEDINKIKNGQEFLDVAASCPRLKIIFDFENDTVENASLDESKAAGSMYSVNKWIFIGAKLTDKEGEETKQREQKIKGVLAHELCHYVMKLVYENQENPYYKHREDMKKMFEEIVQIINKWKVKDLKGPDDECNGIISLVFTAYDPKDFHPELIVRIVQMLTEFDDSEEKTKHLEEKYKMLFDFWFNQVVPELQKYLNRNEDVIRLNRTLGLLPCIQNLTYEVCNEDKIEEVIKNKLIILQTNVPKLLFINIHEYLKKKNGNLLDSRNLFINLEKVKNLQLWDDFKQICLENQELGIFVDCSKKVTNDIGSIFSNNDLSFIFVVSTDNHAEKLTEICKKNEQNALKVEIKYNWDDLTEESQNSLLNTKINFQNNSNISLMDLLEKSGNKEKETLITAGVNNKESRTETDAKQAHCIEELTELIDGQLLNLFLENQQILINTTQTVERYFELLFNSRNFKKKTTIVGPPENMLVQQQTENDEQGNIFEGFLSLFRKKKTTENKKIKDEVQRQEISQDKLLSEVNNKQYVLISDMAGNGKSWAMKNFAKAFQKQNPTHWVTYVDLKQFIDEFKEFKDQEVEPEFSSFLVEHILKPQHQFEAKTFQKLYNDGKVFILFDGFDEIAPNYAEFLSKLAQNFQQNGGNQLWIATRDYFEVNLKEQLEINEAYCLNEMTEEEGVDLIAQSWVFIDLLKNKTEPKTRKEFGQCIKKSTKYESYQYKARQIIKKAQILRNNSVGLPQLFKMIADGFKDEENIDDLQGIKIYIKFIDILYKRWSQQKGEIRNQANTEVQKKYSSFFMFLGFHAILSFFPKLAKILFPDYDGKVWENEIIACGILTIIDGKVYFIHETFREYFAADAITKALSKEKVDKKVLKVVEQIFTVEKFKIIRKFVVHACNEQSVLEKVKPRIKKFVFLGDNFGLFFTENLENLANFGIEVLKSGSKNKAKEVLNENISSLYKDASIIQNTNMFLKLQDLLFDHLKVDDLKDREQVRQGLMLISFDDDNCEGNIFYFLARSSSLNAQKVQKLLKIMEKFLTSTEIFELMSKCNEKKQNILHVCANWRLNIENLKILWTEIENYYLLQNLSHKFKELVQQQDKDQKRNILYCVARYDKIEVHETLWKLLLKLIEDREELKDFILQKDKIGDNFVYDLVRYNKNPAIIEWTFKILKENFSDAQFQEILTSKGFKEMNLLQSAAYESKVVEVHQFLWKLFQDFCGTDEKFLEMLKEVDKDGRNILQIAARNSPSEVFEFMIQELEKIASRDEIRKMLRNLDIFWSQNLLHSAAQSDKNEELHKTLWKTYQKYFEKSEIMQFINIVDKDGNDLLFNAVYRLIALKEILELTWNEIISFFTHDEQVEYLKVRDLKDLIIKGKVFLGIIKSGLDIEIFEDFVAEIEAKTDREFVKQGLMLVSDDGLWQKKNIFYFLGASSNLNAQKVQKLLKIMEKYSTVTQIFELMSKCNSDEQNILRVCVEEKNQENLKILWTETEKYFTEQNLPQNLKEFVKQQDEYQKNILYYVDSCDKIEVHETLWELLLKLIKDREELKEFILQKNKDDDNCVHQLVKYNKNPAIIEFTFKILKENFSDAQFQEILTSKGYRRRNLLQSAAYLSEVVEVHQFLWKFFRDFCGTDEKFLEMLKEVDKIGQNIIHIAAYHSSSEVFEFMIQELEKIASRDDIRKMLRNLSLWNQDLMQLAAYWNSSSEFHKTLWKTLRKYFEKSEILQFINNVDKNGNNLLFNAVFGCWSSKEIVELTWNEIKSFLSHDEQVEYLKMKGEDGKNLTECAFLNVMTKDKKEIQNWIENLMQVYKIKI